MKDIELDATIENIDKLTEFVNNELEAFNCPMKAQMEIDVAIDEIFSNIANYAYKPNTGKATVSIEKIENPLSVSISFIDGGKPYNPLEKDDPNINASIEERGVGGLGIFMVKKSMNAVEYEYKDGKNVLTIKKNI